MFNRAPAACRNNMNENIMMTTCFHAHQYNADNDAYAFSLIVFIISITAAFNESMPHRNEIIHDINHQLIVRNESIINICRHVMEQ